MRTWLSLALGLCSMAALAGQSPQTRTLTPGVRTQATLPAGQTNVFTVALAEGDFAVVTIEQTLGRTIVTAADPADHVLLTAVWPEPSFVAATAGAYRLTVSPNRNGAPPGTYDITVSVRPAREADRARAAAERALSEARLQTIDAAPKAEPSAMAKYSTALSMFEAASYRPGEVYTHQWMGLSSLVANDVTAAREHFNAAAGIARAIGDDLGEADALQQLATTYRVPAERPVSLEYNAQALRLYERIGNVEGEAGTLNNIAHAHNDQSDYSTALESYDRALALSKSIGDRGNVARIYVNRSSTLTSMGRIPDALDSLTQARATIKGTDNPQLESMMLNNSGIAYKQLGDYRRALEVYDEALAAFRRAGNAGSEAQVLNNIGNVHQLMEQYPQALNDYNQALTIARRLGQRGVQAASLNNIGTTYLRMGDYTRALDHHQQAMAIRQSLGDRSGEASALSWTGVDWHKLGQLDKAAAALQTALDMRRQLNEANNEAETLLNLAEVERDAGDPVKARTTIESALALTESLRSSISDANLRASYIARVEDTYASYVDILMRAHLQAPAAGHDREALAAAERSRARVLLESLAEARSNLREGVAPSLLAAERAQQRKVDAASARLSELLTTTSRDGDIVVARDALAAADREYQQIRTRIRSANPHYAALTQPEPLTTANIQHDVLDSQTVLLEFSLGNPRSWLWAVTPDGITSVALPSRTAINAAARACYEEVTARQPKTGETSAAYAARVAASDRRLRDKTSALSQMLFGGIAAQLNGVWRDRRLAIVSDGALGYLPFAALPAPRTGSASSIGTTAPLLARHEIVELPSASVLATLRDERTGRTPPAHLLAVLADPVFEPADPRVTRSAAPAAPGDLPYAATRSVERLDALRGHPLTRLPFSREEATAITALARTADTLSAMDFEASRTTALSGSLADYRIVHFATHGLIDSERPDLSGLVLSLVDDHGKAQDGFLRLTDIYNLTLNADLVVLSACQTALGKEIRGEGLVSLTRGFMYAGTPRIVASLWQVSDLATAELMKKFYTGLLQQKLSPAAALRAAQLELSRDPRWRAPYYWAGFVLAGDWK